MALLAAWGCVADASQRASGAVAGPAAGAVSATGAPRPGDDSAAAIGADALRAHVERLAHDELEGRQTGSAGGALAADYILAVLDRACSAAGGDAWLQDIGWAGFAFTAPPELIVSRSVPEAPGAAYGVDWVHLEGGGTGGPLDVVVARDESQLPAAPRSDAALLLLASRDERDAWLERIGSPDGAGWGLLVVPGPPSPGTPRPAPTHGLLRRPAAPAAAGVTTREPPRPPAIMVRGELLTALAAGEVAALDLRIERGPARPAHNVVGRIPGVGTADDPALADEVVVLSAHYDHIGTAPAPAGMPHRDGERGEPAGAVAPARHDLIYNGADDDASGVAFVLAIAEAFAAGPPPARTLVFLLATGEEHGLLGTEFYLDHPAEPLERTVANLNFEMVGRPDELVGGAGRLWLTGHELSNLGPALEARGLPVVPDPRPEQRFFWRSDNFPFVRRGVVGQSLSSYGMHADYHAVSDEADTLDGEHMQAAARVAYAAARLLAEGAVDPAWLPGVDPLRPPARR